MVLARTEAGWLLENMLADVDPFERKAASWGHYDYGEVAFVSAVVTGKRFSAWLSKLKGKAQGYEFRIPKLQPRVNSERYTSRSSLRQLYLLPYPFTLFPVDFENRYDGERRSDFTPLVKDGLPSFPNFGTAMYRLLYDLDRPRGTEIHRGQIMICLSHPDAWIEDVDVEREAVTVGISGMEVEGARLTVGGPSGVLVNEVLNQPGAHKYEIRSPDSANLWLVLSRGDRWLDSREVGGQLSLNWDVTGIQPGSLATHIQELLLRGENEHLEYKAKMPGDEKKFLKTVAAFANGAGGIILLGVADDAKVEGIKGDVARFMDGVANSIHNGLTPQPDFHLERCEVDHKQVVGVFVAEGKDTPYGLSTKPPSIYVRRAGTTFDATQAEIKALALKNQPQQDYYGYDSLYR
jgi:hypothetical protein